MLIYPLSLAIYCTSWTFFGSGRPSPPRTSVDLPRDLCRPDPDDRALHAAAAPRDPARQVARNITSIADFIARALRQEPGGSPPPWR